MFNNKVLLAQLSLILVTLVWGCTFTIVKEALNDCPPFAFAAWRFTIAAIGCLLFLDWKKPFLPDTN